MASDGLGAYREALLGKRAELSGAGGRDAIAAERDADLMDEVRRAAETEVAMLGLQCRGTTLRAIAAALGRIEDGSYGICTQCGSGIGFKRLRASPWAALCIHCQEQADRKAPENTRRQAA